ncbi:hypothetical protein, partial [Arthrobacter sp. AQ5-05]|uniref:hypothetical protein n=1 Tax=Arthrobacter sp. AQ5-05 TaxID=2184581 RepID=UPI001C6564CF
PGNGVGKPAASGQNRLPPVVSSIAAGGQRGLPPTVTLELPLTPRQNREGNADFDVLAQYFPACRGLVGAIDSGSFLQGLAVVTHGYVEDFVAVSFWHNRPADP